MQRSPVRLVCAALLAALAACGGGGGVDFPDENAAPPTPDAQRQDAAKRATALTETLRQSVAQAVAAGQPLTTVQGNFAAQPVRLPGGGAITDVRVEYGGAIVVDVALPPTTAGTREPPQGVDGEPWNPPATAGKGQMVWVAYPAAPGIVRWYCFGSYAQVAADTNGTCLYPGDTARAMTWATANGPAEAALTPYDATHNISMVECNVQTPPTLGRTDAPNACNPYSGDWHVLRKLPLLCVRKTGMAAPEGWNPPVRAREFVGGDIAVTAPVYGVQLLGKAPGDTLCQQQFGEGWTMAAFHDGGGWGFYGVGRTPTDTRFWVRIRDASSNPWCSTLTGLPCLGD
jgi:predicted small lipoprotein YifL